MLSGNTQGELEIVLERCLLRIWAFCLTSNHVHKEEYDGVTIDEVRTSARTECPCRDEDFISRIEEPQMGAVPIRLSSSRK